MKKKNIVRAWRDEDYFLSLSDAERRSLPSHPAGLAAVDDQALNSITGGCNPGCGGFTSPGSTVLCTPCPGLHCGA